MQHLKTYAKPALKEIVFACRLLNPSLHILVPDYFILSKIGINR